ncbi:MAG TPA: hypothetical protein VNX28_07835 [Gemmataceae bacterium]|jgi:hypothetical protein|nr:hypothetical protein [Gemmataceae bacterium]
MNERNERHEIDMVDRATAALRDAPIPEGPPPQLAASTTLKLQALTTSPNRLQRRNRVATIVRYCAAAAATLLVVLGGAFWLIDRNATFTFAQVVDKVSKAKSVSFVVHQKIGKHPELETRVFIRGDVVRYEIADFSTIVMDWNQRKGLRLDTRWQGTIKDKVARKIDLEGRVPKDDVRNPIDRLRHIKEGSKDNAQQLGDEVLDQRNCHVYQVNGAKDAAMLVPSDFKLWVDAKTGLPVKIHAQDENTSLLYEDFKWNEPLQEDLFSLAVPKDFRLKELTPAVVKPGRIYYHQGWIELHSIEPDGKKPEVQFVPRLADSPNTYVSGSAELSPDGRYLAIAYTYVTKDGAFPPYRVLLWDRTRPKEEAVEVYSRPDGELQTWQFSGNDRLWINWWEGIPGRKGPDGRTGTDFVDMKIKDKMSLKLPMFKDAGGKEAAMRFAASGGGGGLSCLVVGQGLHVTRLEGEAVSRGLIEGTAEVKLVRRLTDPSAPIVVASVRLSPDGKQALYATYQPDLSQQLFVVPLVDGAPKELVGAGKFTDIRARWSPDGKRIAYTSRLLDPANPPRHFGTETYLKLIDPDGANPVTLLTRKVQPNGPSLELTAWQ